MKIIASLIGGLSAAFSVASFGLAYDSTTDAPGGTAELEHHAFVFKTELANCASTAFCSAAGSIDSDFISVFSLTNTTTCSAALGTCSAVNVADTYTGAGGASTNGGGVPTDVFTRVHSPNCNVGGPIPCLRDILLNTSFDEWNFTANEIGKLSSGYVIADSDFAGNGTIGAFNLDTMIVRTYRGTTADATFNSACAVDPNADYLTCMAATQTTGPATEQPFQYITTPMSDLELAKAVPVPAFAAAILGLGLVAITVLTGRRRQVK